jgi:hypothetical protein
MLEAEACWLRQTLDGFAAERLSPLLNLGCGDAARRKTPQPWIEDQLFAPLRTRGIDIVHVDMRPGPQVDVQADLTDPADVQCLRALQPRALLCCNLLEHVLEPERLARHCLAMLAAGGLVFVTVPFSYPYHGDPIDTMFRPAPQDLTALFAEARLIDGTIIGTGRAYLDDLRQRPLDGETLSGQGRVPDQLCCIRKDVTSENGFRETRRRANDMLHLCPSNRN